MMDILDILNTIKKDWPLLVFVFAVGGAWWQGKEWFKKIDEALNRERIEHSTQTAVLDEIHQKVENLEFRINSIETTLDKMHEEQREQEVKLAVLESTSLKLNRRNNPRS